MFGLVTTTHSINPATMSFQFVLWDVGHGLAIWIKTPNGHNHWIDAGREGDFSPSWHVRHRYGETALDYLIISHPDDDHICDLADLTENLGRPRVLLRNTTLPDHEKFESGIRDYQQVFKALDSRYNSSISSEMSPQNSAFNGGVIVKTGMLTWSESGENANNTSVVAFYHYEGWLFVMPGDIDESGWTKLWGKCGPEFQKLIDSSHTRILVAPHHGRDSGYSVSMFDSIKPHLTLISDKKAKAETCRSFRDRPFGTLWNQQTNSFLVPDEGPMGVFQKALAHRDGFEERKFFSTKTGERLKFNISPTGQAVLDCC